MAFASFPAMTERHGGEWRGAGYATRMGLRAMKAAMEQTHDPSAAPQVAP